MCLSLSNVQCFIFKGGWAMYEKVPDVCHTLPYCCNLTLKSDLCLCYHRGSDNTQLPTVFCDNCIVQSNQDFHSTIWDFWSFCLWVWDDYMPEATRRHTNKTTFIILKILHFIWNTLSDWSKSWCNNQIQISLEHN